MALQGKNGGVLSFSGTGLEQAIEKLKQIYPLCGPALSENKEIQQLVTAMNRIIAVLKDAERKQISSERDRLRLWELKQVVFDAEDLIDELATDAAVQSMGALIYNIPTRMMDQICKMNGRLDRLEPQIDMLDLKLSTIQDSCRVLPTWRQTSSLLPDETSVIGRGREKEQIIEMLTDRFDESSSNIKGFSIVPIVGLGGVGKTTLAQLAYNDEKVKNRFELRMWVCVSNDFDLRRLTKDITEAALVSKGMNEQYQVNNWDSMQRRLLQEVEGKTFLLVLDDVWEAEHSKWEALFKPLCSGKKGSKVLVTSRHRAFVNELSGPMEAPIPLGGLSDTDIWDVCKKYAFREKINSDGTTSAEYSHLQVLGSSIVQKLKGSPLAAKTIGSLLNRELSEEHWKTVLESEFWKLEQGEEDILPALLLSYQYLTPDLKQCFAYCSLFPKDYRFSREEVVQLWEAQSFIRKDRGTRMEMMGSKYVDELLCMSFFESNPGYDKDYYVMHDLIHDLAEYVSRDDCFRLEDQKLEEIPDTAVRHVSIWVTQMDQIDMINELCCYEKLRTLLFRTGYHLGYHDLDQLFLKLKMLRVLGLNECGIRELPGSITDLKHLRYIDLGWNGDLTRLPESLENLYNLQVLKLNYCGIRELSGSIGDLKHLRYIDLQGNYHLENLPESLGNLYNLQVLNLSYCGIRELPGSIDDLKHLRHIDLQGNGHLTRLPETLGNLYNLQVLNLNYCNSLRVLPSTISQLVNLKDLLTYDRGLLSRVDGVGKLTGLQELQVRGRQLRELGGMCMIKELIISNLEELGSKEEAIQARLHTMERLQVLRLEWSDRRPLSIKPELEEEVLQALRPNEGIRKLHIQGYGGSNSPDWMEVSTLLSSFSSLRCVSLEDCPNWQVPPCSFLSQLRHLESLVIHSMPEWEEWSCPVSWDCLLDLTIDGCPRLKELPFLPPTLRSLYLFKVGISCLHSELDGCGRVEGGIETTSYHHSPPTSASLCRLDISYCDNLTSIGGLLQKHLPDLEKIEISYCKNLVSLPEKGFGHLVSLKRLNITQCPKVTCLLPMQEKEEDASTQHLPCSLEELEISQCGDAMGGWWWAGLQRLTSIVKLSLCGCPTTAELLFLSLGMHHHHLPATLRELLIDGSGCDNYEQQSTTSSACSSQLSPPPTLPPIPHNNVDASAGVLRALTSLKELTIRRSPKFLQKWGGCGLPSSLERLDIVADDNLDHKYLSACLHDLIALKNLTLKHVENLRLLSNLSVLTSLETLDISKCPSPGTVEVISLPTSLETLTLDDFKDLRSLPDLSSLASLKTLNIWHCPSIETLDLEFLSLPTSLQNLKLRDCKDLRSLPNLSSLTSLETLHISPCPSIETLDLEVLNLPTSLQNLTLSDFKDLRSLPDLSGLASLKTLNIWHCPSIQSWPTSGLPSSLQILNIQECPALTERHKDKPISLWPEVAHILLVMIDRRRLE